MIFTKAKTTKTVYCPKCKKKLDIDGGLKKAFCQYCGTGFAFAEAEVQNTVMKEDKKSNLEKIFGFIERQQDRMEEKRQKRKHEMEVERERQKEWIKKYWWAIALFGLSIIAIIMLGIVFE